jgi:ubiquinone/menaquinone biosynthesis C-methylase UbiE
VRELALQALSSVEGGYDLLAPKFDHTPFRTPDAVLDATAGALRSIGPFGRGLDVCCGTGAGLRVLGSVCQGPVVGVDFSTGMLTQARRAHPDPALVRADVRALPFAGAVDLAVSFGALGHFLPAERPALFAGVHRALGPGGAPRRPSPHAGTGPCSGSTWPCGSAMPCGGPRSSCTTAPARCTRSATT